MDRIIGVLVIVDVARVVLSEPQRPQAPTDVPRACSSAYVVLNSPSPGARPLPADEQEREALLHGLDPLAGATGWGRAGQVLRRLCSAPLLAKATTRFLSFLILKAGLSRRHCSRSLCGGRVVVVLALWIPDLWGARSLVDRYTSQLYF